MNGFFSTISISNPLVLSSVEGLRRVFQEPAKLAALGLPVFRTHAANAQAKTSEPSIRGAILLILLYLILPVQALLPIDDPDVWWRFRVGQWIVQNHGVPFVDYYSAYDTGKPWIEYSWLFALLMYGLQAQFGLIAIAYFIVAMALAITAVVHRLIHRSGLPLFAEVAFAGAALASMKSLMTPRPWLITILFFALEILIIEAVRRTRRDRLLWILPPLFAIWANFHIQFVYGLAVIFVLAFEAPLAAIIGKFAWPIDVPLAPRHIIPIAALCAAATLLTPYHFLLYRQIFDYIGGQTGIFQNISELHPMFFRTPGDWLVLFLALSSAFALGWRQKWAPYHALVLVMSAFWTFRSRRDVWALVIIALSIIGATARAYGSARGALITKRQMILGAAAVTAVLCLVAYARQISEKNFQAVVGNSYPVQAVNYIKQRQLPGPLYNDYDWGGFLIWNLSAMPVVMDGRVNLYGDARFERSLNTWQGGTGWETDPDLLKSNLVIAQKNRPLTALLRLNAQYKIVYEDGVAVVFVRLR